MASKELCKSITHSVENAVNTPFESSALLPDLSSDEDIEGILKQISELLGTKYVENSQPLVEGNDNVSIEDILKEAEDLVRATTPFFEKTSPYPIIENPPSFHQKSPKEHVKVKNVSNSSSVCSEELDSPVQPEPTSVAQRAYKPALTLDDLKVPSSTYVLEKHVDDNSKKLQSHPTSHIIPNPDDFPNMPNCLKMNSNEQDANALDVDQRLLLLQDEIRSQESLIEGYQNENQRLSNELISAKDAWKDTENQLLDRIHKLDQQLQTAITRHKKDNSDLNLQLKQAYEAITSIEKELKFIKDEKCAVDKINHGLTLNLTRLNSEIETYKKEIKKNSENEKEKFTLIEDNAAVQAKLSQANSEITKKQTEIIRLNGEIGRLRGELEKIRLGSVVSNASTDSTNVISQLKAALAMERENCRDITKESENLKKQIKEMEFILIKRSKSNNSLDNFSPRKEIQRNKIIDELAESREHLIICKKNLKDLQAKYDHDVYDLEQQLKRSQREIATLKNLMEDPKHNRRVISANNAKEDAHLMATIRGLKLELNAREKDLARLNKELDDTKKTNKRLQKERERVLNNGNKLRVPKDLDKGSRGTSEVSSSKDYNPSLYEDNQETLILFKTENRNLKQEIKRLEQDLISLHNKRIQDLSDLQDQHESEMAKLIRENTTASNSSAVSHFQSQLYTQQMVIKRLKDEMKQMENQNKEMVLLKTERDHLESTLIEANKKIARLHELASPENLQYAGLLEKLEFLERRHEVREQKLQAIVRDLIAKQNQAVACGANCRDKFNKNRECYYRSEIDKILAALAEFNWN